MVTQEPAHADLVEGMGLEPGRLKVFLLEPPVSLHGQRDIGFKEVLPHIGIGYIAAVLRAQGHDVHVADCPAEGATLADLIDRFHRLRPDVVGFSSTTYQIHEAEETARAFRKIDPAVRIVIGGPHVSAVPGPTLEDFEVFDWVVFGEGELTTLELMDRVQRGASAAGIAGLAHRDGDGGAVVVEPPRSRITKVDALPWPAFDIFPLERYRGFYSFHARRYRPLTLCSARGCPYQCNFCYKSTGDAFKTRSVANVLGEIERNVEQLGANQLVFTDEVFTLKHSFTRELLSAMESIDLADRARWICQTRVDRVTPDLLAQMKRAGCEVISYGIEAGNQDILNRIAKGLSKEQACRAIQWTHDAGISPDTNFIIGNAYETRETIQETIRFAVELNPDTASFAILSPFPGTEVAEMAEKGEGGLRLLSHDWRHYGKQVGSALELEGVPRVLLERYQRMAYMRFYLRFRKVAQLVKVVNPFAVPIYVLHHVRSWLRDRTGWGGTNRGHPILRFARS